MLGLTDSDNVQENPGEIEIFWPIYEGTFPITPSSVIGLVRWPPVLVLVPTAVTGDPSTPRATSPSTVARGRGRRHWRRTVGWGFGWRWRRFARLGQGGPGKRKQQGGQHQAMSGFHFATP